MVKAIGFLVFLQEKHLSKGEEVMGAYERDLMYTLDSIEYEVSSIVFYVEHHHVEEFR